MKKGWKVFLCVFACLSFIMAIFVSFSDSPSENQGTPLTSNTSQVILYYGVTCPHCHDMIGIIKENGYEDEFDIVYKEVYNNKTNSGELLEVSQGCNLNTNSIGVPFAYYQGKCYIGVPDIAPIFA